jgi:hypothetical protein
MTALVGRPAKRRDHFGHVNFLHAGNFAFGHLDLRELAQTGWGPTI